jgi:hypothetical protein
MNREEVQPWFLRYQMKESDGVCRFPAHQGALRVYR